MFPRVTNALDIVARTVAPNKKCGGCLHYDTHRTACLSNLMPQECGDGSMPEVGYAPLSELRPGSPHEPVERSAQAVAGHDPTANNESLHMEILGDEAQQLHAVLHSVAQVAVMKSQRTCVACSAGAPIGRVNPALASYMQRPHSCSYDVEAPMVKSVIEGVSPRIRRKLTTDSVEEMLESVMENLSKGLKKKSKKLKKDETQPAAPTSNHGTKDWYGGGSNQGTTRATDTPSPGGAAPSNPSGRGVTTLREVQPSKPMPQKQQGQMVAQKSLGAFDEFFEKGGPGSGRHKGGGGVDWQGIASAYHGKALKHPLASAEHHWNMHEYHNHMAHHHGGYTPLSGKPKNKQVAEHQKAGRMHFEAYSIAKEHAKKKGVKKGLGGFGDFFFGKKEKDLHKAAGSRGGKVIGTTRSGKPIYQGKQAHEYHDFNLQDHEDAHEAHAKRSGQGKPQRSPKESEHLQTMGSHRLKIKQLDSTEKSLGSFGEFFKAKGAGSRGGHVIGHTSSGKPVYQSKTPSTYSDFTAEDHADASWEHTAEAGKHPPLSSARKRHDKAAKEHTNALVSLKYNEEKTKKQPVTKIPPKKELAALLKNPSPAMQAVLDKMRNK